MSLQHMSFHRESFLYFHISTKVLEPQAPSNVLIYYDYQNRTEQNRTLLKIMHLRPLTGGVRDKHKHVMQ